MKHIVAIDFDGVLHNPRDKEEGRKLGKPISGAVEGMEMLRRLRYQLIVFTVEARLQDGYDAVAQWLVFHKIPFDEITAIKPDAIAYLDDKAITFTNWDKAVSDIRSQPLFYK